MKKVLYSILSVSFLLFTACTEDRGTTTEVADANKDENVNESHIKDYGQAGAAGSSTADADYNARSQHITQQMATDMQLDEATQKRVAAIVYDRERRLGEMEKRYNYNETNRMGGQANNDTRNDRSDNTNVTADPNRSNNSGNAYEGNSNLKNETGSNMEQNNSNMASERSTIMADADKELKAILTPQQYSLFEKNRTNYSGMSQKNSATGTKPMAEGNEKQNKP